MSSIHPGSQEQRRERRFTIQFPVDLGFAKGVTRDISESGCYIETDRVPEHLSDVINFSLFIPSPHGGIERHCIGKVLRVDEFGDGMGLGIKIINTSLTRH